MKPGRPASLVVVVLAVFLTLGCSFLARKGAEQALEKGAGVKVDKSGDTVKVQGKSGTWEAGKTKLPDGFPKEFPVYGGAKLTGAFKSTTPGYTAFAVTWETADSMSDVADYYKKALPENGYKITNTMESGESTVFTVAQSSTIVIAQKAGKTEFVANIMQKK